MSIKRFIKNILVRFKFIIYLKNAFDNLSSNYYLRKVSKKEKTGKSMHVAFIVYEPAMWDKQEPVYNELRKHEEIKTTLIVVPDIASNAEEQKKKMGFFVKKYDDVIITNENKEIALDNYDYIFYQTPYCFKYPKSLQPQSVVKKSKICYIPYGYVGSNDFLETTSKNEFFRNVYFGFMDSLAMRELLYKMHKTNCDKKLQNFVFLGYPSLEYYMNLKTEEMHINNILWAPRWSYAETGGGSHFLEYRDNIISVAKEHKAVNFSLRPHPLMFPTLIKQNMMCREELEEYKKELEESNIFLDENNLLSDTLGNTDILICDYSSMMINYLLTGRPIIYCDCDIPFSGVYEKIRNVLYIAQTWDDVVRYINELIKGNDPLKIKREELISKEFDAHKNSSKKIVECIIEDFKS